MSAIGKAFPKVALLVVLALLSSAAFLLLPGCSSAEQKQMVSREVDNSDQSKEITLSFFGYKADSLNLMAIESLLEGFMTSEENVNIIYEGAKGTQYWDSLDKRVETGELDDLFMVNNSTVKSLGSKGMLADISDMQTVDEYNDFAAAQFVNDDGSVYFVPMCLSTYNLYINYDLLKQHNQPIPQNWDEFMQVCDYFVEQGIVPIVGNNFQSLRSLAVAYGMYPIYQQENYAEAVQHLDAQSYVETIRPGLERVAEMVDHGCFDGEELIASNQTSDDLEIFAEGNRPFMITGGWASPRVINMNADLNFGVYPYPIMDDGSVLSMNVDTCVSINADSENLDVAKEFAAYLTDSDAIHDYCESQSSFSPLKDNRPPSDERLKPSFEYLSNGRSVIGSDYKMPLDVDTPLQEHCNKLLQGYSVDEVCNMILADLSKEQ